jgi:hypothetical protein
MIDAPVDEGVIPRAAFHNADIFVGGLGKDIVEDGIISRRDGPSDVYLPRWPGRGSDYQFVGLVEEMFGI